MTEYRFDDRVAIVTGAGGRHNLGRAYARLLAARGARVVVNDINQEGAARVVQEIADSGGTAVADTHDISDEPSTHAIVQAALDAWGRVDILVNNGGAMIFAEFDEMNSRDTERMVDTHLKGAVWMSRAVWPHFKEQGYGRIVMALSTAAGRQRVMYATVKGGMIALNYALALAGSDLGIKCNGIVPLAGTDAMAATVPDGPQKEMMLQMSPDLVAPVVGYLAHEDCPVTGEEIFAMNGMVSKFVNAPTREGDTPGLPGVAGGGYSNAALTIEDVAEHWTDIVGADFRPLVFPDEAAMGMTATPYVPS